MTRHWLGVIGFRVNTTEIFTIFKTAASEYTAVISGYAGNRVRVAKYGRREMLINRRPGLGETAATAPFAALFTAGKTHPAQRDAQAINQAVINLASSTERFLGVPEDRRSRSDAFNVSSHRLTKRQFRHLIRQRIASALLSCFRSWLMTCCA